MLGAGAHFFFRAPQDSRLTHAHAHASRRHADDHPRHGTADEVALAPCARPPALAPVSLPRRRLCRLHAPLSTHHVRRRRYCASGARLRWPALRRAGAARLCALVRCQSPAVRGDSGLSAGARRCPSVPMVSSASLVAAIVVRSDAAHRRGNADGAGAHHRPSARRSTHPYGGGSASSSSSASASGSGSASASLSWPWSSRSATPPMDSARAAPARAARRRRTVRRARIRSTVSAVTSCQMHRCATYTADRSIRRAI